MTSLVEFPARSALSRTFSLDFFRLAASLIMMLSFLPPLGPIFTAESSRKVFQHQRVFQCAFVFPEMNSVQDNSQEIITGPLPEGRFSRMHGIQDDKTPSSSYRLNEKKGKRAPKRSVGIAFTVVLKTLDTSACHELVYAATGEKASVRNPMATRTILSLLKSTLERCWPLTKTWVQGF